MRERAALLGGRVHIRSSTGRGTVIRLSVPMEQQPGERALTMLAHCQIREGNFEEGGRGEGTDG